MVSAQIYKTQPEPSSSSSSSVHMFLLLGLYKEVCTICSPTTATHTHILYNDTGRKRTDVCVVCVCASSCKKIEQSKQRIVLSTVPDGTYHKGSDGKVSVWYHSNKTESEIIKTAMMYYYAPVNC